ncbi:EpsG family protein [Collinsella tanakaei]|uniref:EpsG family protein n=1 Tax=Collinsella tanakaei TaxID=626935 RepID=UPI0025A4B95D|nr:EpsG family protein [Collinsella tanakaei]MDM8246386.1 EpsG family protein [Collinsella tanakaei]
MITLLYCLAIVLGIMFEWPKGNKFLDVAIILLCTYMVFSCTNHADYHSYEMQYATAVPSMDLFDEPLWKSICFISRSLGLGYRSFIALVTAGFLAIALVGVHRITPSSPYFWSLFLIFPGLIGFVQIRQLLALCLVIFAFSFLAVTNRRNSVSFSYLIVAICAAMIHSSAFLVILIEPLAYFAEKEKPFTALILLLFVSSLVTGWTTELARDLFTDEVSQAYLMGEGGRTNDLSRLFTLVEVFGSVLLVLFAKNQAAGSETMRGEMERRCIHYLLPLNLLFIAMLPTLMVNTDFLRLHRYVLVLDALLFVAAQYPLHRNVVGIGHRIVGGIGCKRLCFRICISAFYFLHFFALVWMQVPDSVVAAMLQW